MIQACDELDILRKKNQNDPAWINRDLYRKLYNPTLYLLAYQRIKSKPGNMTPGVDGQTLDGYSIEVIQKTIQLLKMEHYEPTPVRRVYIPKKATGKYRPLGVPSPRDKMVQECLRLILESIYEPNFHPNSHGFRPGRSCHTALESLQRNWVGTKWVIEADIAQCFDRIDHHRLLDILRGKIQDERFINLIRKFLKAGYMENWQYHQTYSGIPQGSVISPILTNIYLDRLDQKLADICQHYSTLAPGRKASSKYTTLFQQRRQLLKEGEAHPALRNSLKIEIRKLNHLILHTPRCDFHDATYIRVKFLRYADDVIVGIIGPKSLAMQIREEMAAFLKDDLKLTLNQEKTLITHLPSHPAHFLGYLFKTSPGRYRRRNLRCKGAPYNVVQTVKTNTGNIKLLVPLRKLSEKLKKYMEKGQPESMRGMVNQPVEHIIEHYNAVIRGWYNYYQLAENVSSLNYARYILQYSLAKTLAHKEGSTMQKIFRKYGKDLNFEKPNGRKIHFFNQPLKRVKRTYQTPASVDQIPVWGPRRTQSRLLNACLICGSTEQVEMHHVRHVRKHGESLKGFTLYMSVINRKQVPVCQKCHQDIHKGKYDQASLASLLDQFQTSQP